MQTVSALHTPLTPTLPLYYHIPKSLTLQTRRRQAIVAAYDVLQKSNEGSEEGTTVKGGKKKGRTTNILTR